MLVHVRWQLKYKQYDDNYVMSIKYHSIIKCNNHRLNMLMSWSLRENNPLLSQLILEASLCVMQVVHARFPRTSQLPYTDLRPQRCGTVDSASCQDNIYTWYIRRPVPNANRLLSSSTSRVIDSVYRNLPRAGKLAFLALVRSSLGLGLEPVSSLVDPRHESPWYIRRGDLVNCSLSGGLRSVPLGHAAQDRADIKWSTGLERVWITITNCLLFQPLRSAVFCMYVKLDLVSRKKRKTLPSANVTSVFAQMGHFGRLLTDKPLCGSNYTVTYGTWDCCRTVHKYYHFKLHRKHTPCIAFIPCWN